jgi:hypothetical protein
VLSYTVTNPTPITGGSLSYFEGRRTSLPVDPAYENVGITHFTSSHGIASEKVNEYRAPLVNDVCGTYVYDNQQDVSGPTIEIHYSNSIGYTYFYDGYCHIFVLVATDGSGNTATFT